MADCIKDGCSAEAVHLSNYCLKHKPKAGLTWRLDESLSEFSEQDGYEIGRSNAKDTETSDGGEKGNE